MKNKKTHNKMTFNKSAVTELNNNELAYVNGGSSTIMPITLITYLITRELP